MIKNQVDKVTPGIKPILHVTDSCSCTTCDSMGCFTCRRKRCSYGRWEDSKTKIFYESKGIDLKESCSESSDLIDSITKPASKHCCMNGNINAEKPTMDKSKYSDLESRLIETLDEIGQPNRESDRTTPIEQLAAVENSDKETESSVGVKLSAQIMDLSYKDFKKSLSYNRSDTLTFKISKLSKYDLVQKIREVYKACSCKVCECLVGKSTRNDSCSCKPCECKDCMSYMVNMQYSKSSKTLQDYCKQYENTFAGISKKFNDTKLCKCKPCECIECADNFKNPCNCEPCQCVDCKSMCVHKPSPVIVAPVVQHSQRNLCHCSPCECIECGLRSDFSRNLMHEMATGTIRQRHPQCRCELCQNEACEPDGVGSCKCDRRNRVMCKPVERDAHDYDIRTVLVNDPTIRKPNRYDTITMFAALSNNYPNFTHDNTKQCNCDECESLENEYKENVISAIKSSQLFTPDKLHLNKARFDTRGASKCHSWECEICYKYKGSRQKCLCDICDCDICRRRKAVLTTKRIDNSEFTCRLCECNNCDKINIKLERQRHYNTCLICKRCLRDDNHKSDFAYRVKKVSTSRHNASFSCRDSKWKVKSQHNSLSVYHAVQTLDFPQPPAAPKKTTQTFDTNMRASMSDNKSKRKRKQKTCNFLKCDAYTQYKNRNKGLYKSISMEYKASGSYYSDSSSIKTNSKSTSYYKDNGSVTAIPGHKDNSCESSCNSSGYDYPDYLVQFPKSTVETCLNEVMKLNLDTKIKLNRFKINPNTQTSQRYLNSAAYENAISGKKFKSQCYEENRKYKKYYKRIDAKQSSPRGSKQQANNDYNYTPLQCNYSKKIVAYSQKYDKQNRSCFSPAVTRENNIYITVNISTQTGDHRAGSITESTSSITIDRYERKNGNRRNLQIPKNLKEFQIASNVSDYNIPNQAVSNMTKNDQFLWRCSHTSPFKYFSNSTDFFKIDEDYKRIQNTLREAKVLTSDLMKILEKYEKDNREFESVSKNLKLTHPSILNNSYILNKETHDSKSLLGESCYKNQHLNEIDHELRQIHLENSSIEENTSLQVFPKVLVNERFGKESAIIQQTLNAPNLKYLNRKNRLNKEILLQENPNEVVKSIQNGMSTAAEEVVNKENDTTNQALAEATKEPYVYKSHIGITYNKIHRKYRKLMKRTVIVSKKIRVQNTYKNDSKPAVSSATTDTCNTLAQETVVQDNRVTSTSINTTAIGQSITINESENIKNDELNRVMRKLDAMFASTTDISVCTSIDKMDHKRAKISVLEVSTTMQTQDMERREQWLISKMNFDLVHKASTKNRGMCIFPPLELEMNEAVKSTSLQTMDKIERSKHLFGSKAQYEDSHLTKTTVKVGKMLDIQSQQQPSKSNIRNDNSNIRRKSKLELELQGPPKAISLQTSLQKLDDIDKNIISDYLCYSTSEVIERQVQDILNLSLLQPIMKLLNSESFISVIDTEHRLPRIESSKSSCEGLKASFLGLRRVSDHTVLVKWNLPREVTDVQGYELLVDGRAVHKIFGPSKRMAVITCLPHTDKILLTIRTITAMVAQTGHFPAASVVYHPRN